MTLSGANVNFDSWVPAPTAAPAPTCALPPANIQITKTAGSTPGVVDEVTSIQPKDDNLQFRVVSCNYMYNLATSSLAGVGTYNVEVVIGGTHATGNAIFGLK